VPVSKKGVLINVSFIIQQAIPLKPILRLFLLAILPLFNVLPLTAQTPSAVREVAVTIDDLPVVGQPHLKGQQQVTRKLLSHLRAYQVPAIGFVNEVKLYQQGRVDTTRIALLQAWLDAGMELGNHTYSHPDLHHTPVANYLKEISRGEIQTKALLAKWGTKIRYFRHPFLHTGRDLSIRDKTNAYLSKHGYRVAPVTIDNSDWLFARAYDLAVQDGDTQMQQRVMEAYIPYMESKVAYFEEQSVQWLGREIRQVLLLHSNAINADGFDRLAAMLQKRGYRFITLDRALEDPAYQSKDTFAGPGGISWLHRWVLTDGGQVLADEPRTPNFVQKQAKISE
jgi:peptidoglycan/xylan/chitin deacetylase (PgdA/CDA1 family)